MPRYSKTQIAVGVGAGLVGTVYAIHKLRQWLARREMDKLRDQAARGEVSTREFLEFALKSGQPSAEGALVVTAAEAQRMPCSVVFPASLSNLPEFAAAIAELRRNGTCL